MTENVRPNGGITERHVRKVWDRSMSRRRLLGAAAGAALLPIVGKGCDSANEVPTLTPDTNDTEKPATLTHKVYLPEIVLQKDHITLINENSNPGNDGWKLVSPDVLQTPAFTNPHSAVAGEKVDFHVASQDGSYNLGVFRLGWYGGKGGRLMYQKEGIACPPITTEFNEATRTASGTWEASHSVTIPDDWRSGVYVAVATAKGGAQSLAPFWVRSKDATAPIMVGSGLLTFAAYNLWSKNYSERYSLYDWRKDMPEDKQRAYVVSLDKPLRMNGGGGELFVWGLPFVRWLERSGIDADYYTDVDSHNDPEIFNGRKLIVMAGHHEYYTNEMRQRLDDAVDKKGINLALFGANACYWRVRLSDTRFGKNRAVVCYKDAGLDPADNMHDKTVRFRDSGMPETELFGIAYEQTNPEGDDWVVSNPEHWVFEGTGLQKGDHLKKLVGREYDAILPQYPTHGERTILTESQVNTFKPADGQGTSYSVVLKKDSGAQVLALGSLDWTKGLDDFRPNELKPKNSVPVDVRTQIIAGNILKKLS